MVKAGRLLSWSLISSSLIISSCSWCLWWHWPGKFPLLSGSSIKLAKRHSIASLPSAEGISLDWWTCPVRCRQHPRCCCRPFSHLFGGRMFSRFKYPSPRKTLMLTQPFCHPNRKSPAISPRMMVWRTPWPALTLWLFRLAFPVSYFSPDDEADGN